MMRDDIGEGLLFLAVEGLFLKRLHVLGGEVPFAFRYSNASHKKPAEPTGAVIDSFADLGLDHLHDGTDERARRVILAAVSSCVAHVLDFGFVEMDSSCFSVWERKRSSSIWSMISRRL